MQGGFAKCYEFTHTATGRKYAAKIIEKATLTRSKAKEKVRMGSFSWRLKLKFTNRSSRSLSSSMKKTFRTPAMSTSSWSFARTRYTKTEVDHE